MTPTNNSTTTKENGNIEALCMATHDESCDFKPVAMERRPVGDYDVLIDMKYCGICHSDLHTAASHLSGFTKPHYPCVPGHELAGIVEAVGAKVTKVKVNERVGVGCMVGSCQSCKSCKKGEEQKCKKMVGTYGHSVGVKPSSNELYSSPIGYTLGGYTNKFVTNENFIIKIPDSYPLEYAGPVMCAGITMYDPLKKAGIKEGSTVGIVGLGGLGQMGVHLAKAMGATVSVISRSDSKKDFAMSCGASTFIVSTSPEQMKASSSSLDLIINTVPSYHDYCFYNSLLNKTGRQVILGLHVGFASTLLLKTLIGNSSRLSPSMIGGIANTQEVMNLCAAKDIKLDIKIVGVDEINGVYEELDGNNDKGIRYVIDIANTLDTEAVKKCNAPAPKLNQDTKGRISYFSSIKEFAWLFFSFKWY